MNRTKKLLAALMVALFLTTTCIVFEVSATPSQAKSPKDGRMYEIPVPDSPPGQYELVSMVKSDGDPANYTAVYVKTN